MPLGISPGAGGMEAACDKDVARYGDCLSSSQLDFGSRG